jgi:L-lactate dehydrogenase complex protein LldE
MNSKMTVTLFVQCLVDGLYPEVAEAVVRIFERLGIPVHCPTNQTCCGLPAFNSGYRQEARLAAMRFIRIFETAEAVVCPAGSCVHMVRSHYPQLFEGDAGWSERARRLAGKTFELSEYLVDVMGMTDLGVRFRGKVTYHDSCHLHIKLGISEQPRALIRAVRGTELVEMKDSDHCCGFGGSFSFKYPVISGAILKEKVENIMATGADTVVGCDMSCLMNIQGMLSRMGAPVGVMHLAQLLAG